MIHKPELCEECKANMGRAFCHNWPTTCKDQLALWLSGFIAGKDAGYHEGFDAALGDLPADQRDLSTIPCPAEGA